MITGCKLNIYQYVTWALENELNENISGIKNKLILWVNLMIIKI